jgi:hypothetical protein
VSVNSGGYTGTMEASASAIIFSNSASTGDSSRSIKFKPGAGNPQLTIYQAVNQFGTGDFYFQSEDLPSTGYTVYEGYTGLGTVISSQSFSGGGQIIFAPQRAEAGRFAPNGNLLIGSTSDNGAKLQVTGGFTFGESTVGTLPTASACNRHWYEVTDASSPVVGSSVSSGGSARALVRSNGSSWIVQLIL